MAVPDAVQPMYLVAIFVVCVLQMSRNARSDEPLVQGGPSDGEIKFYRAFVPDEVILQATDYLPMERKKFERHITTINQQQDSSRQPFISSAEYSARYVTGDLVNGTAKLIVAIPDKRPSLVPLPQMNLAIQSVRWLDASEAAQIGRSDQGAVLIVPPEIAAKGLGMLELQWTLAGTSDAFDAVEFNLQLPRSLASQLSILTTESVAITSNQGLIRQISTSSNDVPLSDTLFRGGSSRDRLAGESSHPSDVSTAYLDSWRIELGGQCRCKLIVTPQQATPSRALVMYEQDAEYLVSLAGIEVDTQILVHKSNQPMRRLTLEANANLQIRSVRWNDAPVPYHSNPDSYSDKQLLSIQIPRARSLGEDVLSVAATTAASLGTLTPLPTIRPNQMQGLRGTARVVVADNLRLQNYELLHAKQLRNRRLASPSLDVQYDSPDASISLQLVPASVALRIANGVTASINNQSITSETVVELRQHPPVWFRLTADIAPGWTIDDVTSDEADLISDWDIRIADRQKLLEIELRPKPPPSASELPRLSIRAVRKFNDPVVSLSQSDITPLKFRNADYEMDLRSLRSTGDLRLDLIGRDAAGQLSEDFLSGSGQNLVDVLAGDLVYPLTKRLAETRIDIQAAEAQFVANSEVTLRVDDSHVSEEFVIKWIPKDTRLDSALVHLSQARSDAIRWSVIDPTPWEFVTRRLAQDEQQRAGLGTSGETWLFVMQDLGTAPRTIRGYREVLQAGGVADIVPSLVMLPNAQAQRATVTLENNSAVPCRVETAPDVEATLVQPARDSSVRSVVASYRYLPERYAVGASQAIRLVRMKPSDEEENRVNCWAWNARLDSYYSADGTAQHRFRYRIENHGRRWIEVRPVDQLKIRRITVGDSVFTPDEDQTKSIRVEVPQDESHVAMLVEASMEQSPWGLWNNLDFKFVRLDIPVLHRQWTVWLPEDYRPVYLNDRLQRGSQPWTQQLFGWAGKHAQRLGVWPALERLTVAGHLSPNPTVQSFRNALRRHAENHLEYGQQMTWGQALEAAASMFPAADVLVDKNALAEEGISPATSIELASPEDGIDKVLQSVGVVFLQDGRRLIVTTSRRRGLHSADFAATIWPDVFQLRQGTFAEQIADTRSFPPPASWQVSVSAIESTPWRTTPTTPLASVRSLDAWQVPLIPDKADGVRGKFQVVKTQASHVLGWFCFVLSFALTWRARSCIPFVAGLVVAIGLVSAAAIPALQPAAWGLLGGLPFGLMVRQLVAARIHEKKTQTPADSTVVREGYKPFSGLTAPPIWALVFIFAFGFACVAVAQPQRRVDSGDRNALQSPASYRVLIPVDEKQDPEGEILYLPVEFYHRLLQSSLTSDSPPQWLIRRADYRARLIASSMLDQAVGQIELHDLTATFEFETYRPNSIVPIPLGRKLLSHSPSAAKLDGRVVQPFWNSGIARDSHGSGDSESTGWIRVALDGTHRLQFTLRSAQATISPNHFSMAIPPIPHSTLSLDAPRQIDLQIPSSIGACRESDGQLICQLGPTDRLDVVWQSVNEASQSADVSARLLSWLDVHPRRAFLNVQIRAEGPDGKDATKMRRAVDLIFDDTMQWLPGEITGTGPRCHIIDNPTPGTGTERLRIPLNRHGALDTPIRFLLRSPTSNRKLRLPTVSLEPLKVIEHWLGVSTEESLVAVYPSVPERLAPSVFSNAWGREAADVDAAFQIDSNSTTWAMNVQPQESEVTSEEILELYVERRETSIHYQAQIEVTGRGRYKNRFRTPQDLKVTELRVLQKERQIPTTYSQTDNATFVLFSEPITGQYSVVLTGELQTAAQNKRPIPLIWLSDAKTTNLNVGLFRAPNSELPIVVEQGFRLTQERPTVNETRNAWRVADLQTNTPDSARATLESFDTVPSVSGQLLTSVARGQTGWNARADLHFNVTSGVVDFITIDVPQSWRETLSVTPALSHQLVDTGGGRRSLQVWLDKPVTGAAAITIHGSLEAGEAITELRPVNIEPLEGFLRLPSATLNERFTWSTSRLLIAPIPETFVLPADDGEYTTYRAVGRGYRAELAATQPLVNLPHVNLTEVHHVIGKHVDYGVVNFHIEPSGLPTTMITMPPGSVLLDVGVGGVPAQLTRVDDSKWQVALGTRRLPHRLRVAYQLPHPPRPDGPWCLPAPVLTLSENKNGRTLWTISSLDDTQQNNAFIGAKALSKLDFAIAKVSTLLQLFDAPDVSSIDYSDPETEAWYAHWKSYFGECIHDARQLLRHASTTRTASANTAAAQDLADAEAKLRQVERLLGMEPAEPLAQTATTSITGPTTSFFGTETKYFSTWPGVSSIEVHSAAIGKYDRRMQLLVAMMMVVAGAALGFGGKTQEWERWLQNEAGVLLFLLGVFWWFAFFPHRLALVFVVAGLAIQFWPRRR